MFSTGWIRDDPPSEYDVSYRSPMAFALHPRSYGWRPAKPDDRDKVYSAAPSDDLASLPTSVDLRNDPCCTEVTDQGLLSLDTADATAAAFQFALAKAAKQNASSFTPSRLFIYYNARRIEGTTEEDTGSTIRSALQSIVQYGVCSEQDWPLEEVDPSTMGISARFPEGSKPATEPPHDVYEKAKNVLCGKEVSYMKLDNDLKHLKGCLAEGYPFIFGFHVYKGFTSDDEDGISSSGILELPSPREAWSQRKHTVLAIGYDDVSQVFIVRNSFGKEWGQKGYFTMPYAYFEELDKRVMPAVPFARNAWTLRVFVSE